MVYCVFRMCSTYVQKRFLCRVQLNLETRKPATTGSYIKFKLSLIQMCSLVMQIFCILCIFNMVGVLRMCSAYMQQRFLCRPRLKSAKLQASHNWLIPEIQACTHSNSFMGHVDIVYSTYIQHS